MLTVPTSSMGHTCTKQVGSSGVLIIGIHKMPSSEFS